MAARKKIEDDDQTRLREEAVKARDFMLEAFVRLSSGTGCELLVRRKFSKANSSAWTKVSLEPTFAVEYRKLIQENIESSVAVDMDLLAYDAVVSKELVGVAYSKEIEGFLNDVPVKGSAATFSGTPADFSSMSHRCIRISMGQMGSVLAFGPSSFNDVAKYSSGKSTVLFSSKKEITKAPAGLLSLGSKVSFVVYKDYIFVIDNDSFASITEFREVVAKRAAIALMKLKKLRFLEFSNFSELEDLTRTSPSFAKKISASDARGVLDRMTRGRLLTCISKFTECLNYSDDGKVVTITPDWKKSSDRKQVEKLIAAVFVTCALTGDPLEARSLVPARKNRS